MRLPRFLRSGFKENGFLIVDFREFLKEGRVEVHLDRDPEAALLCHRCSSPLGHLHGKYRCRVEGMPVMGFRLFIYFWRIKGECRNCKKVRGEKVDFIAEESPHLTNDFSWWIGRLCEIAAVSNVAHLLDLDETTTWRLDFARMKRMVQNYKIPEVTHISVDEVYARKKPKYKGESRDMRFFTVISDLKTRKVIWVSESRKKEALDQFFIILGEKACSRIKIVATDQHEGYAASIRQFCKNADHVWDRFHLMQNFEEALNETRKTLHEEASNGSEVKRLSRGQFRFIFLKMAHRRTPEEKTHIDDVVGMNQSFFKLELIKERMMSFFHEQTEEEAKAVFEEMGDWIWQAQFKPLMKWYQEFEKGWDTIKNYFRYRVTSALSEGINNVIKVIKRKAYGYKNMEYFRLKILQVCGYLNSKYIPLADSL